MNTPRPQPDIDADLPADRLSEFPIAFFAIIMGMAGLTLACHAMEQATGTGAVLSGLLVTVTIGLFLAIAGLYTMKWLNHRDAVIAEWHHPVRIAFFPAISISLLLIATALVTLLPSLARALWIVGMLLQGVLTLAVIASWISHRAFQQAHLTPAWFIPAVGNVIVPVAGAGLGYPEISWLFFSAGLVFWLILLTLVFNRLIFHDPIPARLAPTLVILIAPPAVAFLAWYRLTGDIDAFARILLNAAYVFFALVVTQIGTLRRLPFALSWWALSFPIAALAIASLVFAGAVGSAVHRGIGLALVAVLAVIVAGLAWRTIRAIQAKQICQPE